MRPSLFSGSSSGNLDECSPTGLRAYLPSILLLAFDDHEKEMQFRKEAATWRSKHANLPALCAGAAIAMCFSIGLTNDTCSWAWRCSGFLGIILLACFSACLKLFPLWAEPAFDRVLTWIFTFGLISGTLSSDRWERLLGLENNACARQPFTEAFHVLVLVSILSVATCFVQLPCRHCVLLVHFASFAEFVVVGGLGSWEYDYIVQHVDADASAFSTNPWAASFFLALGLYIQGLPLCFARHARERYERRAFTKIYHHKTQLDVYTRKSHEEREVLALAGFFHKLDDALWEEDGDAVREALLGLAQHDYDEEELEEVLAEKRKEQSEHAGVSVAYLISDDFKGLCRERTEIEDPNFYELKDVFFFGDSPIGANVLCPRDGRPGCALVDTLPRVHRRKCTHFLSWTWSYTLSQFIAALMNWMNEATLTRQVSAGIVDEPQDVFLFICFFVNNQYRLLVEKSIAGSDNLEDVFEENLKRIGKVVAMLDHWDEPRYLSRIWTIYEQFVAVKLGFHVKIILPPGPIEALIREVRHGDVGIMRVKDALCKVDSEHARATMPEDEARVQRLITDTCGFRFVDKKVREFLISWVATSVQDYMTELINTSAPQPFGLRKSCSLELEDEAVHDL